MKDDNWRGTSRPSEWTLERTFDVGQARKLVIERSSTGFRAVYGGFGGYGPTQTLALDDLLALMRRYCEAADELARSLAPGGRLHEKLGQLRALVDGTVDEVLR